MDEGDRVEYLGTLPNGPATVIEVGDRDVLIELAGTGRVVCGETDVVPRSAQ